MGFGPPSPLREKILKLMKDEGAQTINDIETKLGISNGSSRSALIRMKKGGLVERIGTGKYQLA